MKFVLLVAIFTISSHLASARILQRCDIARELTWQGFPRWSIPTWVCIVQAESSGNTAAVGPVNSDGSRDYGLFQINNRWWCGSGFVGLGCNVSCDQLVTDDITKAADCAELIYSIQGFSAWTGWTLRCQGSLPNVDDCGI